MRTATWKSHLEANRQSALDDFVALLRMPSVSAADAHVEDVLATAAWVAERLTRAGVENVAIRPTGPHACVYGDWLHAPGKPIVLIYGHFDVQPADPLDLWDSPPFEPTIADGRIVARGASDMKGNLLLSLLAVEALLKTEGALPVNVKFLYEGQEEIGSRDLGPFVAAHRDLLACDLILSADGMQWAVDQPALWLGFKGMCALEIDIETAGMDMHSGLYGGAVPNAAHALVELLAGLRNSEGRILVEGFFDQVLPITPEEREKMQEVPFDADAYRKPLGVDALVGEPGYTTYERTWARPTLEINGLWGGYQGDGVKTVIPAKAHAKITCRLVADQQPAEVLDAILAHLEKHKPAGSRLTVTPLKSEATAYRMPVGHPGVQAAAEVLAQHYGKTPYFVRMGGSLPITTMFLEELGAYTVSVGFGQEDERIHSPNEFFRLTDFERGQEVYCLLLERLGHMEAAAFKA